MSEPVELFAEVIEPSAELAVTCTPAVITDNLAALDAWVDEQIAPYVGASIDCGDEGQVKEARRAMADLNALKKPIEDERKRVKRAYDAPLKAFEAKVKGTTSKIDAARAAIKKQVDEADRMFRERRRALLEEEYEGVAGAMAGVIGFPTVLDESWLNRSTPEARALALVGDAAADALRGYEALMAQEIAHKDEVVRRFAETLDVAGALALGAELDERDRRAEEFRAAQEAMRAAAHERAQSMAEAIEGADPAVSAVASGASVIVADAARPVCRWSLSLEFEGTDERAREVAAALKSTGLTGSPKCLGVVEDA